MSTLKNSNNVARSLKPASGIPEESAYQAPSYQSQIDLKLDSNEGLVPDEKLLKVLENIDISTIRCYPKLSVLEQEIAKKIGISTTNIMATAGGDDALDRACRAVLESGDEVILPEPTFEMISQYATVSGASIVSVDWPEGDYPTDDVISAITPQTKVIAVVTPNNPTGAVATEEDLRRLSEAAPEALLLVDLAYAEFAEEDLTNVVLELPNAVAIRTLSKAWGLAGLRVGYAVANERILGWMRACTGPYMISGVSLKLAIRALELNEDVEKYISEVKAEREALSELLEEFGARPLPSQANFVFAEFPNAKKVWQGLYGLGIAVRFFGNRPELKNFLRITCPGNKQDFATLIKGLRTVFSPEAILFDLDGVIADVSKSYRLAVIETAKLYGISVTDDEITKIKANGNANNDWELTTQLLANKGVEVTLEEVKERFEHIYQGTSLEPGAYKNESMLCEKELFHTLGARFKLGVVTGRPRGDAERFLNDYGIRKYFQALICMNESEPKPSPEPVTKALSDLGAQTAWMIGDTPDDIVSARKAFVVPVGVVPPGVKEEAKEILEASLLSNGAACVINSVREIEGLLNNNF